MASIEPTRDLAAPAQPTAMTGTGDIGGGSDLRRSVSDASRRIEEIIDSAERVATEIRAEAEAEATRMLSERREEAEQMRRETEELRAETERLRRQREEAISGAAGGLRSELGELRSALERTLSSIARTEQVIEDLDASPAAAPIAEPFGAPAPADAPPEPAPFSAPPPAPEPFQPAPVPPAPSLSEVPSAPAEEPGDGEGALGFEPDSGDAEEEATAVAPSPPAAEAPVSSDEAMLRATQMAVAGSSRDEIGRTLEAEFGIDDPEPILGQILGPA